jgi:hypothetical protein
MTSKIIFTAPVEPCRFAYSVVTLRGYTADVVAPVQHTSSCTIFHCSSGSSPTVEKEKNGETDLKKQEGIVELTESRLAFPHVPWWS